MAVKVDVVSAKTPAELSTAVTSANVGSQMRDEVTAMETGLSTTTNTVGGNCDVIAAVKGVLADAEDAVRDAFKTAAHLVGKAMTSIMETIGDIIKAVKAAVNLATTKITEFCTWLRTQSIAVLDSAKAALKDVFDAMNSIASGIASAVSEVATVVDDIAEAMADGVKKLVNAACVMVSSSLRKIGNGAGVDGQVAAVTGTTASIAANAMSGVSSAVRTAEVSLASTQSSLGATFGQTTELNAAIANLSTIMGS